MQDAHALLREVDEPALLLVPDGRIVDANEAFGALLAVPREDLVATRLQEHVGDPSDKVTEVLRLWSRSRQPVPASLAWRSGGAGDVPLRCDGSALAARESGDVPLLLLRCRSKQSANARFRFLDEKIVALNREIARRRAMEAQLLQQATELARSNRELEDYAYAISHDLKEPLRGIGNYTHLLLREHGEALPEGARQRLVTVDLLTRRMGRLLDSLLEYARAGRQAPRAPLDLGSIVAEALDGLHARIDEHRIEVVRHPLPRVVADRVLVGQVFVNLLANAIAYNDKPLRRVEIGCGPPPLPGDDDGGEFAAGGGGTPHEHVLWVRDNGIGIARKHFEAVFRVFKRLHGRDAFGGGAGVGLAIVKKIVERLGGRVWLESTPNVGSTFAFTLPAAPAAAVAARPKT